MDTVDDLAIARWRLHNLRLAGDPFDAAEDVVRWLGAVQSQDYGPAKWSVAARTGEVGDAAMDQAYSEGTILRTHLLRPTWHFVLPEDIRWLLQVTAPRVHALNAYWYRQLELDAGTLERSSAVLANVLQGGNHLTRKEIAAALDRAGIAARGPRLAYILMNAELNALICSGPLRGKQHTYALLDERAPQARRLSPDEALAELTIRYFTSHGPATPKDFQAWSSLRLADIKRGLRIVEPQLNQATIGGVTYWFAGDPPPNSEAGPDTAHLLQGYDEYLMGYRETRDVADVAGHSSALPEGRTVFNGVLLFDSQMGGHWRRTASSASVTVEAALYTPPDGDQRRALQDAADRYGRFLGMPVTVAAAQC